MDYFAAAHMRNGVGYTAWRDRITQCMKDNKIELILEEKELHEFYHEDFSVRDVYFVNRLRTVKSGSVDIHWWDEWGQENVTFTENQSLREFYKKNPKLREVMEPKPLKNYNEKKPG